MRRRIPPTVTVTFLEQCRAPATPASPLPPGYQLVHLPDITTHLYRHLYARIGLDHLWAERLRLDDAVLERLIHDPSVEIHVLYHGAQAIGFAELSFTHYPDIELVYFGLIPEATGLGLGRRFLSQVIDAAWLRYPNRLLVQTSTLDHPGALRLYEHAGFLVYDSVSRKTHELV